MKKFQFQFDSLLKLRKHHRQICRQALANLLQEQQTLDQQQHALVQQQNELLQEIRQRNQPGLVNINEAVNRRYYSGQLKQNLLALAQQQATLSEQLLECRQSLIKADQEVKALEQLAEKQQAVFLYQQERRAAHELDDTWLATRGRGSDR